MGLRMFSRKILNDLDIWADQNRPKPLIVRGVRQVGKTTAVELFADYFEKFILLNLPYFLAGRLMEYAKWLTTQHSPT
jgi:predicted AAA+ superfamily ATPase